MNPFQITLSSMYILSGFFVGFLSSKRKGRSTIFWSLLCSLIPLSVVILWIIPNKKPYNTKTKISIIEIILFFIIYSPVLLVAYEAYNYNSKNKSHSDNIVYNKNITVNGKWDLSMGILNSYDMKYSFGNKQNLTISKMYRENKEAANIIFTIKNENFPCSSEFVIIYFPSGDKFIMKNIAKNCPEGYSLFSSDLDDEEKIAKTIYDGSQLPIGVSQDKINMSFIGEVNVDAMKTFIKELKYISQ